MYHDVSVGEAARYTVSRDRLRRDLAAVLGQGGVPCVVTFDDGHAGTFLHGLPALHDSGIVATLFVTTGFLGRPGFMDEAMLREWHAAGQRVGSHSVTHRAMNLLGDREICTEFADSRARLEDIVGSAVEGFSVPGGNFSAHLAKLAFEAGYRRVYTSRPAFSRVGEPIVPRFAIRATTPPEAVERLRAGHIEPFFRADRLRFAAKRVMGPRAYFALRSRLHTESIEPYEVDRPA
jgi:peptidoglycan/xylan/chitin deacetylase (PgdA/CDA1 family)